MESTVILYRGYVYMCIYIYVAYMVRGLGFRVGGFPVRV